MTAKSRICIALIILFHTVGLVGFLIPAYVPLFKQLVPLHLLLMAALLVITQKGIDRNFWITGFIVYAAGFGIEWIGVHTGIVFGNYAYGPTLGIKLMGIPLLIGINWFILIYTASAFLNRWKAAIALKALAGAALLTGVDYLIEPVAIRFEYWSWQNGNIPLQNYIAWFAFSFVLFLFYFWRNQIRTNPAAEALLIAQILFFAALNLWAV